MTLLDRVLGLEEPIVTTHAFGAALGEYARDEITVAQIHAAFDITAQVDIDGLQIVLDAINPTSGPPTMTSLEVEDILILGIELGAEGTPYYPKAKVKTRLGL